jgi:TonB family protein
MYKIVFQHVFPFLAGMFLGLGVYYYFAPVGVPQPESEGTVFYGSGATSCWGKSRARGYGYGSGSGSGYGSARGSGAGGESNFLIISKPKAVYTEAARENDVEGTVRLKVVLLASGQVGSITPVTRLPFGLTEQAVAAARRIEFEPARVNGVPVSKSVTIEYGFSIY